MSTDGVRAVVFDLWYTLVSPDDHRPRGTRSIDVIVPRIGVDADDFEAYWKVRFPEMYRSPRPVVDYVADYLERHGRRLDDDDRADIDAAFGRHHDQALASPRDEVLDALGELATGGLRLGVLSNAHEREIRKWETSPLAERFEVAFLSCHAGCAKPDPEAYTYVLDKLGVDPVQAVFVGDGGSDELPGARAVGFRRVVFMRGFLRDIGVDPDRLEALGAEADATIDRVGELPAVLDQ